MRILFKRKLDQLLAKGSGEQLVWLCVLTIVIIAVAILIVTSFFRPDGEMSWEDVIAIFIDSGYSLEPGSHYWFRLILAVLSTFVFSALLISVFTNIFDNIGESVRSGERRYSIKGFALVIGFGPQISNIVSRLRQEGKTVVVFCKDNPGFGKDVFFYSGDQTDEKDLCSANPSDAECIYIMGDASIADLDSSNLKTLSILKKLVPKSDRKIHCFLSVKEQSTKEVLQYMKNASETDLGESGLIVNMVNEFEYQAEQLFIGTDFLPVIRQSEDMFAHFIVFGSDRIAVSTALTLAHICHYPSYASSGRRTRITMIDPEISSCYLTMLASRPVLFDMSHYSFVSAEGKITVHVPESDKDFLDIEWVFVEACHYDTLAKDIVATATAEKYAAVRILVCHEDSHRAVECTLHLPEVAYTSSRIALYLNGSSDIVDLASSTGMYGDITLFGPANDSISDPLMLNRLKRGQRVNFVYDKAYSDKPAASEIDAWYSISEADKCSSIYCASALPLRKKCFDFEGDRMPIYEAEHRRWMMSSLLMGFRPGPVKDKKRFIHPDIVPFDALAMTEKDKDKILIDAIEYIVG